jgi:shikimate 5-dehydrogenase
VCDEAKLVGYNTDALGFRVAVERGITASEIQPTAALIYGYGGVTFSVVAILKKLGITDIYITGRNKASARARSIELGIRMWEPDTDEQMTPAPNFFVSCAPVTSTPLHLAANYLSALEHCQLVFDHELNGICLQEYCAENGKFLISGMDMYQPQMISQWSLFLEHLNIPRDELEATFLQAEDMIRC